MDRRLDRDCGIHAGHAEDVEFLDAAQTRESLLDGLAEGSGGAGGLAVGGGAAFDADDDVGGVFGVGFEVAAD